MFSIKYFKFLNLKAIKHIIKHIVNFIIYTSLDDILKKRRKVESEPIILEKIILFILIFLFKISASIKIIKKSNQIFRIKTKSTYTIITTNYILVN